MSSYLERIIDDTIGIIDQLALEEFEPGTPKYNCQQALIAAANTYNKAKAARNEN